MNVSENNIKSKSSVLVISLLQKLAVVALSYQKKTTYVESFKSLRF